jgi:hypothetical protein
MSLPLNNIRDVYNSYPKKSDNLILIYISISSVNAVLLMKIDEYSYSQNAIQRTFYALLDF